MLLQEEDQEEAVAALDLPEEEEEASKHSRWQRLHHAQAQSLTQVLAKEATAAAEEAFSARTPESLTVLAKEAS